jgi:integrase
MGRRSTTVGHVERLPTGKYRARFTDPQGKRRSKVFPKMADARAWLSTAHTDILRKEYRTPEAKRTTVGEYATRYLTRRDLKESTRTHAESLWRLHLAPHWAGRPVVDVRPAEVTRWHDSTTAGPAALAASYRLLRAILARAVDDELIPANPCRVRGASNAAASRPARVLTPTQIAAVVAAMPPDRRTLTSLLAWSGLRIGEAVELRRRDVLDGGAAVRVERRAYGDTVDTPKTKAGSRVVHLPGSVARQLAEHLEQVDPGPDALLFTGRRGNRIDRRVYRLQLVKACEAVGVEPIRVHELRHTGATAAAVAGATTAELMARLGHASPAASLRYQHSASERDRELAARLDRLTM